MMGADTGVTRYKSAGDHPHAMPTCMQPDPSTL